MVGASHQSHKESWTVIYEGDWPQNTTKTEQQEIDFRETVTTQTVDGHKMGQIGATDIIMTRRRATKQLLLFSVDSARFFMLVLLRFILWLLIFIGKN